MLVKMRRDATADEIATVEHKLHDLGFKTGKLEGEEITLVGVYGDISKLPAGEIEELPGVEQLIPISRAYKRVGAEGDAGPADLPDGRRSATSSAAATTSSFIAGPVLGRERAADHGRGAPGEGGRLRTRCAAASSSTARARTAAGRGSARPTPRRCATGSS